ncbi:pyroglutamyl-peptidase I [Kurthia massiliensis]|uniref:pyroglutamyl-peptidase I n=1 Tax=Kurthia massiliensis TaxID=1033739 RepID=UPI0002889A4E|nr:pyroglutamyl-peptidase I [Kurthia massiliensis]
MKLLLTGFEPFLNLQENPTMPVVAALDRQHIGEYEVIGHILPVAFHDARVALSTIIEAVQPDLIVSLGVAVGRYQVTPERIAINVASSTKPDNTGHTPQDEPVIAGGAESYMSRLPIQQITAALNEAGYPARISDTAGTYVCNTVMYEGLRYAVEHDIAAGFIHIPANFELSIAHGKVPGWHQRDLNDAIRIALETIVEVKA